MIYPLNGQAVYTHTYPASEIPFDRAQALRYFGYSKGRAIPPETEKLFDECVEEVLPACVYRVCYAVFEAEKKGEDIDLGFMRTRSKSLSLNLDGCRKVVAFAATVGVGVDRLISRYASFSSARAYAAQAIGAERIESLCDCFNGEIIRKCADEGLFSRPRFSCGYGDFSLEKQSDFFAALDCNRKIGLTLNDSLLMSPSKSVTALIGISDAPCARSANKCAACYKSDCEFREGKKGGSHV